MYGYIVKRLLMLLPTLLGAAILVFLLLRLVPGDICLIKFGGEGAYADPEQIKQCQERLGLTPPIYVQFVDYIGGFLTFDLGTSMWTGRAVGHEIAIRFELSLQIAIMATLTSIIIAIPLGVISAAKQNTAVDYLVRGFSIAGSSATRTVISAKPIRNLASVTFKCGHATIRTVSSTQMAGSKIFIALRNPVYDVGGVEVYQEGVGRGAGELGAVEDGAVAQEAAYPIG